MTTLQDTANTALRMKPTQMALLTLGYTHDTIVTGEDMQLRVSLPGVEVTFRLDPVTQCLEAVMLWEGRLTPEMAGDALHYLVQLNQATLEPQFSLVELEDQSGMAIQGRVFLFAGVGVTWEQTAEFVHYCLTEIAQIFVGTCAQVWPEVAPVEQPISVPERPEVEFSYSAEDAAAGNPFGLLPEPTPEVTLERIHDLLAQMGADDLQLVAGEYVEFTLLGQRVSVSLTAGRDGRDRQTLVISSGSGLEVDTQDQLNRMFYLCNDTTCAHVMATVFAEEIENGARWGIFVESRFDLAAGLSEDQLGTLILNTSKWNSEMCLILKMKSL